MQKVLVVAAHPDDEVLGVGGTIANHTQNKDQVSILILGDGETARDKAGKTDISKRVKQAEKVAKLLKVDDLFLEKLPDNQFDTLPLLTIVKKIEKYLRKVKPNLIYTHFSQDLNIDHQLTFKAVLTACRPQPGSCIKQILGFETLSSTHWQISDPGHAFCPNQFHDIRKTIDKKIQAMKIYRNELQPFPHPRSIRGIRTLAQLRGMQSGCQYAEAFQVIRNIV
jgi:LmbE family N-acetylglucosaminyl deacetylase